MSIKQVSSGQESAKVTMTTQTQKSLTSKDDIIKYKSKFKKKNQSGSKYKYKITKKKGWTLPTLIPMDHWLQNKAKEHF